MEQNPQMFPYSSPPNVLSHLRSFVQADTIPALTNSLERFDGLGTGTMNFHSFYSAVREVVGSNLVDQEIITLARAYATKKSKEYDSQSISAVAQDHLRKNNFEAFQKLTEVLQSSDSYNHADRSLTVNDTRCILKGFKLPLPDYLLDMLLQNVRNEAGNIDLNALLSTINWRENIIQHPKENNIETKESDFTSLDKQNLEINYNELIKEIN